MAKVPIALDSNQSVRLALLFQAQAFVPICAVAYFRSEGKRGLGVSSVLWMALDFPVLSDKTSMLGHILLCLLSHFLSFIPGLSTNWSPGPGSSSWRMLGLALLGAYHTETQWTISVTGERENNAKTNFQLKIHFFFPLWVKMASANLTCLPILPGTLACYSKDIG